MLAQIDSEYVKTSWAKVVSRLISYGLFEGRPLTTRGRWINPLVFAQFSMYKKLPCLKDVRKPVFIVGTGRSGTTVLGVILSLHKDVGFLNEPKALWHSIYPDEDVIGSYSRNPGKYCLDEDDVDSDVIKHAHRLFSWYLTVTNTNRVVDKYPELIFRAEFVKKVFPDAKFVFLVRNGLDTCHSIDTWSRRLGVTVDEQVHDWWGLNGQKWQLLVDEVVSHDQVLSHKIDEIRGMENHIDMAAVEWIVTMRKGLELVEREPNRFFKLRYEDLVAEPAKSLLELQRFCELDPDASVVNYAVNNLKFPKEKPPVELHPVIHEPFYQMMNDLGYQY